MSEAHALRTLLGDLKRHQAQVAALRALGVAGLGAACGVAVAVLSGAGFEDADFSWRIPATWGLLAGAGCAIAAFGALWQRRGGPLSLLCAFERERENDALAGTLWQIEGATTPAPWARMLHQRLSQRIERRECGLALTAPGHTLVGALLGVVALGALTLGLVISLDQAPASGRSAPPRHGLRFLTPDPSPPIGDSLPEALPSAPRVLSATPRDDPVVVEVGGAQVFVVEAEDADGDLSHAEFQRDDEAALRLLPGDDRHSAFRFGFRFGFRFEAIGPREVQVRVFDRGERLATHRFRIQVVKDRSGGDSGPVAASAGATPEVPGAPRPPSPDPMPRPPAPGADNPPKPSAAALPRPEARDPPRLEVTPRAGVGPARRPVLQESSAGEGAGLARGSPDRAAAASPAQADNARSRAERLSSPWNAWDQRVMEAYHRAFIWAPGKRGAQPPVRSPHSPTD